jgi:hypothetical protein
MKIFSKLNFSRNINNYTFLFLSLICLLIVNPIIYLSPFFNLIFKITLLLITIISIQTFNVSSFYLSISKFLAFSAFLADAIIFPSPSLTSLTSMISHWCYLLFFSLTTLLISLRISKESKINTPVIQGSICIYLLGGIIFSFGYSTIQFFDPQAFSIPREILGSNYLLYFSFTTLTTVGYGDITPVNPFAMTLSNTEAMIGQLYPAIVIGKLVSLHKRD